MESSCREHAGHALPQRRGFLRATRCGQRTAIHDGKAAAQREARDNSCSTSKTRRGDRGVGRAGASFYAQHVVGGSRATNTPIAAASFRGGATVVTGLALGSSLSIVNCGSLPASGGAQEAASLGESVAGVFSAGALHTTAIGQVNAAAAEASVADISVGAVGILSGAAAIAADFALSQATATCSS